MGFFQDIFEGLANGISSLIGTGYNIYQDQRNFNYQKELQDKLWQRDDNAIQRKMADYSAAGINPLMVASAGGANNTSAGVGIGANVQAPRMTYYEQKVEKEKVKQAQEQTDYQKKIDKISLEMADTQEKIASYNRDLMQLNVFSNLGIPVYAYTYDDNGETKWSFGVKSGLRIKPEDLPYQKLFNNNVSVSDIQKQLASTNYAMALNDMILSNKNLKWDTANRVLDYTLGITGAYQDIMSPFHWSNNYSYGDMYTHSWSNNTNTNTSTNYNHSYKH